MILNEIQSHLSGPSIFKNIEKEGTSLFERISGRRVHYWPCQLRNSGTDTRLKFIRFEKKKSDKKRCNAS